MQLVEAHGGEATVLTLGPPEAEEQLRYAVSVGMAGAVLLPIEGADWDPQRTARAITTAITTLEGEDGPLRPAAVRQRVGRRRRVPGRRARRPCARPADGQRCQGSRRRRRPCRRAAGDRRRCGALRAAAACSGGRQGGHQPAPLPDDEGTAGVEEGDDPPDRRRRAGGRAAPGAPRPSARAAVGHDDPRNRRRRCPGCRRPVDRARRRADDRRSLRSPATQAVAGRSLAGARSLARERDAFDDRAWWSSTTIVASWRRRRWRR